jgi:hypothetical protein
VLEFLPNSTDTHIILTYDNAAMDMVLYINGNIVQIDNTGSGNTSDTTEDLFFGASDAIGTDGHVGGLGGIAFYDYVLTPEQARHHYLALTDPPA